MSVDIRPAVGGTQGVASGAQCIGMQKVWCWNVETIRCPVYIMTSFAFALPIQVRNHLTGAAGGFTVTTDKSDSTSLDCLLLLDFGHGA